MKNTIFRVGTFVVLFLLLIVWACNGVSAKTLNSNELLNIYERGDLLDSIQTESTVYEIAYKGDSMLVNPENETILKDDIILLSNGKKRYYHGSFIIDENNQAVEVEYATTTKSIYTQIITLENFELSKPNFFEYLFGVPVYSASSTEYSSAGDGTIRNLSTANPANATTWDTLHDSSSGDYAYASDGSTDFMVSLVNGSSWITRGSLIFTNDLVETDTIDSADIYLWHYKVSNTDNDGYDYLAITESFQANENLLTTADFEDIGSDNGTAGRALQTPIVELSNQVDISNIPTNPGAYQQFSIFASSTDYINKGTTTKFGFREGHDLGDHVLVVGTTNRTLVYYSEYTGTDHDPYIEIGYTSEEIISTSTELQLDQPWYSSDLTIIKGKTEIYTTSSTTPSEIRYHYYHVPFFAWIIFATGIIIIGSRIILEFIIRFRRIK